jgi:NodT family efflux transporter outer membrane factor (OMF) lipoprotein
MKAIHLFLAMLAIAAAGCAVGPDYHAPPVKAPATWSEPLDGGETNALASLTAWWQQFHDVELDSLMGRAVLSNLDLQIARARVWAARAEYSVAVADFFPTADASASYAQTQTSHHRPVLGSIQLPSNVPFNNNFYQAGFDASWEIDVFGGIRREAEGARARVAATVFDQRSTMITLVSEVARNYLDMRGYQNRLAVVEENIEAQEKALAITRDRLAKGLSSDLDVEQASMLLATTMAESPTLQSSREACIHRLEVLLGQQPGTLKSELSKIGAIPTTPPLVPVGLPSELLLHRPDVASAERQLAAATADIGVAKADLFPKFYLTGIAGLQSISASDWFTGGSRYWTAGPTAQWRIFDAGRIRANVRIHTAEQAQALANYEQVVLTAFEEVENNLTTYANEQIRRRSLQDAVAASQKSVDLANKLYTNGLADFLNVLDAERSLYESEDALVDSNRGVSINLVSLYKSLGGGWDTASPESASASTNYATIIR